MQIKETRFIKNQGLLTVLVLLVSSGNIISWHTKDFDASTEKDVLDGIENGSLQPVMWEHCAVEEEWTAGLPRTEEQIKADKDRRLEEASDIGSEMMAAFKPHIEQLMNQQTREKYIAAALTGLLASGSYHHDEASAVVGLATCYADAAILATQETTEA